ncbi:SRPBCC family protein [Pseudonocardia humida]|uniref:SRPBCC domain-containing protein n=1 Tax=Pseudonocardia humida TaxID=2800819 RepID=A0ABT1A5U1_9PSEU|nr:SRPBCC domain-containing protein [Pseudonocardia humida]MCO1658346.1 SRPBCC domain-containing protein [Pseudonocardia humida]
MTATRTTSVTVDQFVAAPAEKVWRVLTEPELHARWWAPGDIAPVVGHRFHLEMPGFGAIPCEVVEVVPHERFVYTFNESWTLTWQLVAEGTGTRLVLEHSGFDLDDPRDQQAFERMPRGWREVVLPALADLAATLA